MSTDKKTSTPQEVGTMGTHESLTRFPPATVQQSLQKDDKKSNTVFHVPIMRNPHE